MGSRSSDAATPPNIVVIVTDDLDARSVACMPNVQTSSPKRGSRSPTPSSRHRSAVPRAPRSCAGNTPTLTGSSAWRRQRRLPDLLPPRRRGIDRGNLAPGRRLPYRPHRQIPQSVSQRSFDEPRATGWDEWSAFASSDDDEGGSITAITPSTRTALRLLGSSHPSIRPTCSPPRRPISSIVRRRPVIPSSSISRHTHRTVRPRRRLVTPMRSGCTSAAHPVV